MNKNLFKGISVAVVSAVILTTVGAVRLHAEDRFSDKIDKEEIKNQLSNCIVAETDKDKEETVYVLTDGAGTVNKVIVSNHLYNPDKKDKLEDASDLQNIVNMKGYEDFTANGNSLSWNANGKDIYYQGTTEKPLPVDVKIRYFLNGEEKTAAQMAGVSGNVTIRFEFENKLQMTLKDSNEKYYVPFAAIAGTFLDTDNFRNISVTNGRVIDDGDRAYCVGIALPGLKENLGVSGDSLNIPDFFEINAETTDFELLTSLTMVTNEPFTRLDLTGIDTSNPQGAADMVNQLKDATAQLASGAKAIYNGLVELKAGMESLKDGAAELQNGANALHTGTGDLLAGVGTLQTGINQVNTGAGQVATGSNQLAASAGQLSAGAGQVATGANQVAAGAGQVHTGVTELATGAHQVSAGAQALNTGLATLTQNSANLNAGAKQIFESLLANATSQLQAAGVPVEKLTIENYATTLNNTAAYLEGVGMASAAQQVKSVKAQLDSVNTFYTGLNAYTQGVDQAAASSDQLVTGATQVATGADQVAAGAGQVSAGANDLATGAAQVATGAGQLATGADTLATGAGQVAAGTNQLVAGAGSLTDGANALNTGAGQLATGMDALMDGIDKLMDGTNQLTDGALTLSTALDEIDTQINDIVMEISDNLASVFEKLNNTLAVAKEYNTFSGLADGLDGSVKFIYRTASIEK